MLENNKEDGFITAATSALDASDHQLTTPRTSTITPFTMCIIYSTPKTCGNCEAEDIALTNTETCEAVKESKACLGRNEIVINNAWLCPACKVNTARGPSYMEPYDYQPKIRQQASKEETGSFTDKVKKMIGKK